MHPAVASPSAVALGSNWRKVASTDNLEALTDGVSGVRLPEPSRRQLLLHGSALLAAALVLLGAEFVVLVVKALPSHVVQHPALQAVKEDWYCCFLIPLMVPVVVLAVTFNWFSIKLFKHNS